MISPNQKRKARRRPAYSPAVFSIFCVEGPADNIGRMQLKRRHIEQDPATGIYANRNEKRNSIGTPEALLPRTKSRAQKYLQMIPTPIVTPPIMISREFIVSHMQYAIQKIRLSLDPCEGPNYHSGLIGMAENSGRNSFLKYHTSFAKTHTLLIRRQVIIRRFFSKLITPELPHRLWSLAIYGELY